MQNSCIRRCSFGVCSCFMLGNPFNEKNSSFYRSCHVCSIVLLQWLCVPADSCTNGRADLSRSIMSWLVKMECDKNACANCFQGHQHSCQLLVRSLQRKLFFYNLHFSSNFKECKLLVRFASAAMGLYPRSCQKPFSHQCRDV